MDIPADREQEVKAITVRNKDGNVQGNYLLYTLAERQAQVQPLKESDIATDDRGTR